MASKKDFYVYDWDIDSINGPFTEKQAKDACVRFVDESHSNIDNLEILRRWAVPKQGTLEFDYTNWE